ncbi:SDR family NAD(P)-dependent oxidoreductase [Mesobaculum littorinae]|uniref:SDR family NAD(P)-dependent oxidoreductase n=1 Tax=Mesobaculum littorinae TaxID=2486419 RepID=A0A438AHP5_9RHOB|nr:SDR family NAD(P)-dependent oxidoreductase [Mesobaculum littorinae]RVV98117.1 SDR family NAD(P)-dependent oxidoreductase [Mesobaculum littorinae]
MKLEGTSVLVTGGGSGLGAATAGWLAERGARVAVLDRSAEAAQRVADEVGGIACVADVTDETAVTAALDAATEAHGVPRAVVMCAGIGGASRVVGRDGPMPLDAFTKTVQVNLIGSFNVLRLAAHRMSEADPMEDGERGVVIATASVAAYDGQIGQAAYAASKGGIVSMTLPIAREFARFGIRVMTLCPGIFETPLLGELPAESQEALGRGIPYPTRLGRPEEYAQLVESVLVNRYLNGEVIRIDGALRLSPKWPN